MAESTLTSSSTSIWADLIGKRFVLGTPNAKGEHIIAFGGTRWRIANVQSIPAGERVRITGQEDNVLTISQA